jgi:hypothetical protein
MSQGKAVTDISQKGLEATNHLESTDVNGKVRLRLDIP